MGALAVSLLLLFGTSIVLLYLSRGLIFEHKTSSNQVRSAQAMEVAEAGIEWATGMLNAPYDIGADCNFLTTTNISFRKRYVQRQHATTTAVWVNSSPTTTASTVFPGCRITSTGLSCSCPADGAASLGTEAQPSFTVGFELVRKDPGVAPLLGDPATYDEEAVRITAWGCAANSTACSSGSAATAANPNSGLDGYATVTVVLKLRPLLRAAPSSPLTCGTSCTVGGSFNVRNTDVVTNGILINAGDDIDTAPGTTSQTLSGQPAANAMIGSDASLAALSSSDSTCSNSSMFNAYFGSTIEQYRQTPTTKTLSCSSASDCQSKLTTAYGDGWRSFYFDSDVQLSGNQTLGSQADPVTIVTPNALTVNGNWTIYGLIFSNSADWNDIGTGTATIQGAQITCAEYRTNGNGTLNYNPDVLKNARRLTGKMVRVPGSWRDH